jgi:L-galactose dehydrogenase
VFGEIDPVEGRRSVETAIESGINYFDTSPYYGRTLSETRLGEFLEGKRDKVILATKAGRYDTTITDYSAESVIRSVEESLRRLRTGWIDVIQVHDIEFGDLDQTIHEALPALFRLREAGKVRFIGITGLPLTALKRVGEAVDVDTVLTYCRYNLLSDDFNDVLLETVKQRNLGLINASPLHMGALTNRGARDNHPAPAEVLEAAARAAEMCSERGVDIADMALHHALQHPDVAVTLVGMSKRRHVESNVRVAEMSFDDGLVEEVKAILEPVKNINWTSGRGENCDPGAVEARAPGPWRA